MKTLKLTGSLILSKDFFSITDPEPVAWPSLENLVLKLSSMTPSGGWYYTGDPNSTESNNDRYCYDSEEEEEFIDSADSETEDYPAVWEWVKQNGERPQHFWRDRPDPDIFNLLLLEVISFVSRMPSLRNLALQIGSMGTSLITDIEYRIAGSKSLDLGFVRLESHMDIFGWPRWHLVLTQRDSDVTATKWEVSKDLKRAITDIRGSEVSRFNIWNDTKLIEI